MMPSLRKRVTSYFRQLSFHNEPREKRHNINENSFVTKYLQGRMRLRDGPAIIHGKTPAELPNYEIAEDYRVGHETIVGCCTGPNGGLTTIRRPERHLDVDAPDIDFIDTPDNAESTNVSSTIHNTSNSRKMALDNTTMLIRVAGQEYLVTNRTRHRKSQSLGSISDFRLEIETTTRIKMATTVNQDETHATELMVNENEIVKQNGDQMDVDVKNYDLAKSKSAGDAFGRVGKRRRTRVAPSAGNAILPPIWNRKNARLHAISDSLYDKNQVNGKQNGDPIADCFGAITRMDSAILAVADGVNWGEKACIAARSAIHGSLHYLNRTIFNDTQLFDETANGNTAQSRPLVTNTRDVFVCLLRAFSCAHDLILANEGMLTTLTVAVVLPLKQRKRQSCDATNLTEQRYVCCVCNVGDTLAYVYSSRFGLREITKGSHDINCNRDMRDALGALGPVDGINPELGNLTLSVTILNKDDVVMVASDGLTDNFDPNVCRFTVNAPPSRAPTPSGAGETRTSSLRRQLAERRKEEGAATALTTTAPSPPRRHQYRRAKTTLDGAVQKPSRHLPPIKRNTDGVPFVTPLERYELQLLLMEEVLTNGTGDRQTGQCACANELCERLIGFVTAMTSAKRRTLEDADLYYDRREGGVMVEVGAGEKRARRKRALEKVAQLPGKLDHVTVVAWYVGGDEG